MSTSSKFTVCRTGGGGLKQISFVKFRDCLSPRAVRVQCGGAWQGRTMCALTAPPRCSPQYSAGRVIRTQEHERQPQVLRQLLSGLTASLRFLSGGRPPGTKTSFRFSAGSGEGRSGVATRNRSFETWALSITKTTFLQRRVDFLSPRPTACCADRERYQLRYR